MMSKPARQTEQTYDGSTPLKNLMQEMFVENLLKGMNQANAVREAGYKAKQPSNQANQLQRNTKVLARLAYRRAELQAQMQRETGLTERKLIDELAKCAFSNMQDFVGTDEDGNVFFKNLNALSREQMAAVESVKITKQTTTNKKGTKDYQTTHTQFKLHSKVGTLEQLGRHLGIFEKDNEQQRPPFVLVFRHKNDENSRKEIICEQKADVQGQEQAEGSGTAGGNEASNGL